MGQFFEMIGQAVHAAKEPKLAASAIYHNIMLRGQAALKQPGVVGQALNQHYDLNLPMYFAFVLYTALLGNVGGGLAELQGGQGNLFLLIPFMLLAVFFQLLAVWYIGPFMDRLGYRIFGLKVSLERARDVSIAAALPFTAPIIIGSILGITILVAWVPALGVLGVVSLVLGIYALVQSFILRKHVLGSGYLVAIGGPLLAWFILLLVLMVPAILLIAIALVAVH